nr:MAG TPA: hypothetical protein [Bacteriophage sp.]
MRSGLLFLLGFLQGLTGLRSLCPGRLQFGAQLLHIIGRGLVLSLVFSHDRPPTGG